MLASSTTRLSGPRCRDSMRPWAWSRAVAQQLVGEGGEVEVVLDEQLLGGHLLGDLHERAVRAEGDLEGEAVLGLVQPLRLTRASARGVFAEVEEDAHVVGSRHPAPQPLGRARRRFGPVGRGGAHAGTSARSSSQRRSWSSAPLSISSLTRRMRM